MPVDHNTYNSRTIYTHTHFNSNTPLGQLNEIQKNMNLISSMFLFNKHKWSLWPNCSTTHPKTLSFRATNAPNNKPLVEPEAEVATLGSCFTNSSEYSLSMSSDSEYSSTVETIVRGARSHDRLFFQPDSTSCSILESHSSGKLCMSDISEDCLPYKESVAVVMETENPYVDFKESMKEMVEIHELKDWDCLEELLGWYLRMNVKGNHEFIVGAFFDLLAGINSGGGCDGGDGGGDHSVGSLTSVASTFSSPISSPNS